MKRKRPVHHSSTSTTSIRYQIALGALALGLSGTVLADALEFSPGLPYVGADVYQRNINMVDGMGKESFANRAPQGNLYIGTWLNDYFGIEGGWMFTPNAKRVAYNDAVELGIPLDASAVPPEFFVANTTITINGPHLGITGQIPMTGSKLRFIGSAGIALLKTHAVNRRIADENVAYPPQNIEETTRQFSSRRVIPCFAAGILYPVSETLGVRLMARYELTSKFKNLGTVFADGAPTASKLSLKNNTLFGAGFTIQF